MFRTNRRFTAKVLLFVVVLLSLVFVSTPAYAASQVVGGKTYSYTAAFPQVIGASVRYAGTINCTPYPCSGTFRIIGYGPGYFQSTVRDFAFTNSGQFAFANLCTSPYGVGHYYSTEVGPVINGVFGHTSGTPSIFLYC